MANSFSNGQHELFALSDGITREHDWLKTYLDPVLLLPSERRDGNLSIPASEGLLNFAAGLLHDRVDEISPT